MNGWEKLYVVHWLNTDQGLVKICVWARSTPIKLNSSLYDYLNNELNGGDLAAGNNRIIIRIKLAYETSDYKKYKEMQGYLPSSKKKDS